MWGWREQQHYRKCKGLGRVWWLNKRGAGSHYIAGHLRCFSLPLCYLAMGEWVRGDVGRGLVEIVNGLEEWDGVMAGYRGLFAGHSAGLPRT